MLQRLRNCSLNSPQPVFPVKLRIDRNLGCAGRPLLLIAGSGATLGIWTPDLLKTLAERRKVIIFDNRGIGLSTDSAEAEHTADSYAESTVNLIDALGLDQPDVLGWSMGGFITLAIAVKYPDRVHSIVLASTSSGGLLGMLIIEQHMLSVAAVLAQCFEDLCALSS